MYPAFDAFRPLPKMRSFSPLKGPVGALGAVLLALFADAEDAYTGSFDVLDFVDPLIGTANGG